jgi:uncharacterized membrane protein (UPF0127 family)
MKALKLENGDFVRDSNGQLVYVYDADAYVQRIKNRIALWLDEWFLATDKVIDWLTLLQKPYSQNKIKNEIVKTIEDDPNTARVTDFRLEFGANRLSNIGISVLSKSYGEINFIYE